MKAEIRESILMLLQAGAVEIREIPEKVTNDEVSELPLKNQPFLYASGNWGPGYISVKNQVGRKKIIMSLVQQLCFLVAKKIPGLNFVAGNVTGGMIPGWILSQELKAILGREVPFVYIRAARKSGGQKELITGIANNPEIHQGDNGLVVEELVNFAQTSCNGVLSLRDAGYKVTHAATILFYDNPEAKKALTANNIEMVYLFTLPDLLAVAEEKEAFSARAIADYREFLKNPPDWQKKRGLSPVKKGGTI
jgi:orotate phosphoribosyltransferase